MRLGLIIIFSLLGSVGAVAGAGLWLLLREEVRRHIVPCLVSFAAGTLLGAAFLGLIPHAFEHIPPSAVMATVLVGIILFFVLEKLVLWRHCHKIDCDVHDAAGPLILVGDAFHNLADGVIIAAAFIGGVPLGVATGVAVVAHEVPQEVGDFAILLNSGYSRRRAFKYNMLSSLTTFVGAVIAYFSLTHIQMAVPYVMALSASSFLYISMADLIPGLQGRMGLASSIRQFVLLLAGIGVILLFHLHPHP
ncbi:MAG: ZIP zinc transporter [Planctomycetes bacterium DG_23]|nr:MAG: ZIP zinc transporter [Planctomycetes bacterium DG_23]